MFLKSSRGTVMHQRHAALAATPYKIREVILALTYGAMIVLGGAEVATTVVDEFGFFSALKSNNVTRIILAQDLKLRPLFWAQSWLALNITRNVTIEGVATNPSGFTQLDFSFIPAKAVLSAGVTVRFRRLAILNALSRIGLDYDFFGSSSAPSMIAWSEAINHLVLCMPLDFAVSAWNGVPRPTSAALSLLRGSSDGNKAVIAEQQNVSLGTTPYCTTTGSCFSPVMMAWDILGQAERGYLVHQTQVTVICDHFATQECIDSLGATECYATMLQKIFNSEGEEQQQQQQQQQQQEDAVGGGSGGGGGAPEAIKPGVIAGSVVGGVALLSAAITLFVFLGRWRRAEAPASLVDAKAGPQPGYHMPTCPSLLDSDRDGAAPHSARHHRPPVATPGSVMLGLSKASPRAQDLSSLVPLPPIGRGGGAPDGVSAVKADRRPPFSASLADYPSQSNDAAHSEHAALSNDQMAVTTGAVASAGPHAAFVVVPDGGGGGAGPAVYGRTSQSNACHTRIFMTTATTTTTTTTTTTITTATSPFSTGTITLTAPSSCQTPKGLAAPGTTRFLADPQSLMGRGERLPGNTSSGGGGGGGLAARASIGAALMSHFRSLASARGSSSTAPQNPIVVVAAADGSSPGDTGGAAAPPTQTPLGAGAMSVRASAPGVGGRVGGDGCVAVAMAVSDAGARSNLEALTHTGSFKVIQHAGGSGAPSDPSSDGTVYGGAGSGGGGSAARSIARSGIVVGRGGGAVSATGSVAGAGSSITLGGISLNSSMAGQLAAGGQAGQLAAGGQAAASRAPDGEVSLVQEVLLSAAANVQRAAAAAAVSAARSEAGGCGGGTGNGGQDAVQAAQPPGMAGVVAGLAADAAEAAQEVMLGPLIGSGSFGKVYKGTWRGAVVAVKVITHGRLNTLASIENELRLSMSFDNRNVVRALSYITCSINEDGVPTLTIQSRGAVRSRMALRSSGPPSAIGTLEYGSGLSGGCGSTNGGGGGMIGMFYGNPGDVGGGDAANGGDGGDEAAGADGARLGMDGQPLPRDVAETWVIQEFMGRGTLSTFLKQGGMVRRANPPGPSAGCASPAATQQPSQLPSLSSLRGSTSYQCPDMRRVALCALDIARGLEYLHRRNVCHGDLKPGNILLAEDPGSPWGLVAKLADFGLSRALAADKTHMTTNTHGTVSYMCPLVLGTGKVSPSSCVYSYGIILWELVSGRPPFFGCIPGQIVKGVMLDDLRPDFGPLNEALPVPIPAWYVDLAQRCWSKHAAERPTMAQVVLELEARTAGLLNQESGSPRQPPQA